MDERPFDSVLRKIRQLSDSGARVLTAIDGRCAAGKTTLAEALAKACGANLFHADDFFLRPEQRTDARLAEPGGNFDRERFLAEILLPLLRGDTVVYRPFDCHTMTFGASKTVSPRPLNIVEGSYCCHPALFSQYDLTVFLTVSPEEQSARILRRSNAVAAQAFKNRWIPLEERYFSFFRIQEQCTFSFCNE